MDILSWIGVALLAAIAIGVHICADRLGQILQSLERVRVKQYENHGDITDRLHLISIDVDDIRKVADRARD